MYVYAYIYTYIHICIYTHTFPYCLPSRPLALSPCLSYPPPSLSLFLRRCIFLSLLVVPSPSHHAASLCVFLLHVHTRTCICVRVYTCICVRVYMCACVHTHARVGVCVYVCIYMYTHIYIHGCIYKCTHTYSNTHTSKTLLRRENFWSIHRF